MICRRHARHVGQRPRDQRARHADAELAHDQLVPDEVAAAASSSRHVRTTSDSLRFGGSIRERNDPLFDQLVERTIDAPSDVRAAGARAPEITHFRPGFSSRDRSSSSSLNNVERV